MDSKTVTGYDCGDATKICIHPDFETASLCAVNRIQGKTAYRCNRCGTVFTAQNSADECCDSKRLYARAERLISLKAAGVTGLDDLITAYLKHAAKAKEAENGCDNAT